MRGERPHSPCGFNKKTFPAEELRKTFVRKLFEKTSPLEELLDGRANARSNKPTAMKLHLIIGF